MVKLSTQLNAHQKHPVKLPDIKTETHAVQKEHSSIRMPITPRGIETSQER